MPCVDRFCCCLPICLHFCIKKSSVVIVIVILISWSDLIILTFHATSGFDACFVSLNCICVFPFSMTSNSFLGRDHVLVVSCGSLYSSMLWFSILTCSSLQHWGRWYVLWLKFSHRFKNCWFYSFFFFWLFLVVR